MPRWRPPQGGGKSVAPQGFQAGLGYRSGWWIRRGRRRLRTTRRAGRITQHRVSQSLLGAKRSGPMWRPNGRRPPSQSRSLPYRYPGALKWDRQPKTACADSSDETETHIRSLCLPRRTDGRGGLARASASSLKVPLVQRDTNTMTLVTIVVQGTTRSDADAAHRGCCCRPTAVSLG
jgi:hypothetical protein